MPPAPDAPAGHRSGGALILAAGFGRRFGSDKRRYRLPDGRTLLEATLSRYAEVYAEICVVLRPEDDELEQIVTALPIPAHIATSHDAELGMGHSLAAGVQTIRTHWQWLSVGLGDMPFVARETLSELLTTYLASAPDSIIQPVYLGTPGHPVTFPASCFPEMAELRNDQGARSVIEAHKEQLIRIPVSDSGVLQDVDIPPA